jgi:hypothetical protein
MMSCVRKLSKESKEDVSFFFYTRVEASFWFLFLTLIVQYRREYYFVFVDSLSFVHSGRHQVSFFFFFFLQHFLLCKSLIFMILI